MQREVYNPKHREALEADPTRGAPLFDGENPRHVPPKTVTPSVTRAAALRDTIKSGRQRGMQLRILSLIRKHGSLTRQEITDLTGIPVHVVSARVCELHEWTLTHEPEIREAGKRRNEKSGKMNTAYSVIEKK